jgi:hypothetical protein
MTIQNYERCLSQQWVAHRTNNLKLTVRRANFVAIVAERLNREHVLWTDRDHTTHPWRAVDVERDFIAMGKPQQQLGRTPSAKALSVLDDKEQVHACLVRHHPRT